jgi:hypothetical protein
LPLQNRVTPFSTIEATAERGLFMGNRGRLHDERRQLANRGWTTKAWIVCRLSFKDRQRTVMQPGSYTELFFLDEATALAAGHRPCAECRRDDYRSFLAAWAQGSGRPPRAAELDAALHGERIGPIRGGPRTHALLGDLPDGSLVLLPNQGDRAWLKLGQALLPWSHAGYGPRQPVRPATRVELLTPPSAMVALAAGYRPTLHPSAGAN